jgi:tRNA pseudouridine13 synthase
MDLSVDFRRYPYLTSALPGIGGTIREQPQDFQVEEIPAYLPSGSGEHLFLWIEKEGLTTRQVFERLRDLGIPEVAIGVAGLKDKHARTRQWLSIPRCYEEQLRHLEEPRLRILKVEAHPHKLQTGHLRGNRFRILIRQVQHPERAQRILEVLQAKGVPNYFGPQRFGLEGQNPQRGYALLKGKGRGSIWLKRFMIGSLQSLLFNDWLALRLERELYDKVLEGDIAKKTETGGEFVVEDPERESERAQRFEISATGPLYGRKMRQAQGAARALEEEILSRYGLTPEAFKARYGDRRPLRIPLRELSLELQPEGLWIGFSLPKGSYATAVLRELMKEEA